MSLGARAPPIPGSVDNAFVEEEEGRTGHAGYGMATDEGEIRSRGALLLHRGIRWPEANDLFFGEAYPSRRARQSI